MVDRVNMPSETPPEDPAHIEAMAAKGAALREGEPQPAASPKETPSERPEWLPEKFKSPEDMAAAYAELEKKQGKPAAEEPTEKPEAKDADSLEIPDDADADAALKDKGFDLAGLQKEYSENNGLSDETYERLEKSGFTRDDVNGYIAGQLALVQQMRTEAFDLVGGEANFENMKAWAAANLSAPEKAAFNSAIQADVATREMAIRGLNAKYTAEVGTTGQHVHSNDGDAVSGDIFESRAQLVKAMNAEDYYKDPAYRKAIEAKLLRTRKVNSLF